MGGYGRLVRAGRKSASWGAVLKGKPQDTEGRLGTLKVYLGRRGTARGQRPRAEE